VARVFQAQCRLAGCGWKGGTLGSYEAANGERQEHLAGHVDGADAVSYRAAEEAMFERSPDPVAPDRPDNSPLPSGIVTQICNAEDSDYGCTAAEGHTGPHMAYASMIEDGKPWPVVAHCWPQDGDR
jgi:hypothetical protein